MRSALVRALVLLRPRLQKWVDRLGVRGLARATYRRLSQVASGRGGLVRAEQNGRTWWLDPEVALRGKLAEFDTILWLREVVKPGMMVMDIGANVGQMTLECAHLVGPGGRVVAVEPHPGNLALLRKHVVANGLEEVVQVVAAACGDRDFQEVTLVAHGASSESVGSGHQLASVESLHSAGLPTHALQVPMRTVDGLCTQLGAKPEIIKIDVEGAELAVLKGARRTLRECRPAVRMGFHPANFKNPGVAATEIMESMKALGYRCSSDGAEWATEEICFLP